MRGRAALTAKLKSGVDAFDRKMDSRKISFQASPEMEGDTVTVNWKVAYTLADCPDLVIFGREIAVFDGDQISSLRDESIPLPKRPWESGLPLTEPGCKPDSTNCPGPRGSGGYSCLSRGGASGNQTMFERPFAASCVDIRLSG